MGSPSSPSSPKQWFFRLPCCFRGAADDDLELRASLIRSSSTWLRSKVQELPEVTKRCLTRRHGHGRHQSGDFSYDPLSYALNFDDGADEYHNFSSRLPKSPPAVGITCS